MRSRKNGVPFVLGERVSEGDTISPGLVYCGTVCLLAHSPKLSQDIFIPSK